MTPNKNFMEILVENKVLSREDSEMLDKKFDGNHFAVCQRLKKGSRGGSVSSADIGRWWGDSIGYPYMELGKTLFQNRITQKLPEEKARKFKSIPIYQLGKAITIATVDPENRNKQNDLEAFLGEPVSMVFSFQDEIEDSIDVQYKSAKGLEQLTSNLVPTSLIESILRDEEDVSSEKIQEIAGSQAIVELARGILLLGLKEGASDIHIEPTPNIIRVRYRIDGMLIDRLRLEKNILVPLVSRLKIMSNLDITEKRRPQDGRIVLDLSNKPVEYRFSSAPTLNGEKIVLRVLGQLSDKSIPELGDLAFSHRNLQVLKHLVQTPNGVIFVTGPTGSGKTTTLFSMLKFINRPEVNIVTIEDPVEYNLPGINQVQVNSSVNLDFATSLRCFLRQDPDVILVGEVRDLETARIASQAALTGHLVMTTLHTNNSLQAVTRLIEIGVEPFLVAPAVIGVLAQLLVRKLCENCKEKYLLNTDEIGEIFIWDKKTEVAFYRAKGCSDCNFIGYKGRLAVQEVFILNDHLREKIAEKCSILDIQKTAFSLGFKTMRYDGIKKVLQGLTSLEEVNRVTLRESEMFVL